MCRRGQSDRALDRRRMFETNVAEESPLHSEPTRRGSTCVSVWMGTPFQPVAQTLLPYPPQNRRRWDGRAVSLLCLHDSFWRMVVGKLRITRNRDRNSRGCRYAVRSIVTVLRKRRRFIPPLRWKCDAGERL